MQSMYFLTIASNLFDPVTTYLEYDVALQFIPLFFGLAHE